MIVGAVIVYLVLTVPNDIQAGALLKSARKDIAAGRTDKARDELARIVQQYPRTDAAAAATVALTSLEVHQRQVERQELQVALDAQKVQIADLQKKVDALAATPPPAPAPQPQPQPKPQPKKKAPKKHSHRRRR